jgi:hypothetical protein
MKANFLLGLALFVSCLSSAQTVRDTSMVKFVPLPKYYKEQGVIFGENYKDEINITNRRIRFTPSVADIDRVERIFIQQYDFVMGGFTEVKPSFIYWVRQYIGYIDANGQGNIIVMLTNNEKPWKARKVPGKNWQRRLNFICSDDYYKISRAYRVNIDIGKMFTS